MRGLLLGVIVTGLVPATGVPAQPLQSASAAGVGANDSGTGEFNRQQNFRDFVIGVADSGRLTMRPVPALPKDIIQGLEVHDAKGLVVGTVATVGKGFAVVTSAIGSVEVDFPSFAKNRNGLLINMPKARLDAMMARGHPAP